MATVTTNNQYYTDIANAIRGKNGTETQYKPSEMAAAIQAITGGGEPEPPDDGKTRLYITVPANAMPDRPPPRNQVPLYIQQSVANGVTIDWGDGTEPETLPGTGAVNTTHTYEQAGDYVISLEPNEGCELGFGDGKQNCILGILSQYDKGKLTMLYKLYIGSNVPIIGESAFGLCGGLKNVVFFKTVESIGKSSFAGCQSITSINIPVGVVSIGENAFRDCSSIRSAVIPSSVINIGYYAFGGWYDVKECHFLSKNPPILDGNVGLYAQTDFVIYVPKGSAESYKTATNWTKYEQYIQEEPA